MTTNIDDLALGPTKQRNRPLGIYPGWIMIGFAAAANFMSAPGQSFSVAAFKEPMRQSIEVSETNYSLAYGLATIFSGVLLPWVGRIVDRIGARIMLPTVASLLAIACWVLSFASGMTGLLIGFGLVRAMGQGALTLLSAWLVGEWFDRRRGFATALAGLGGSVSVICFPLLNGILIDAFGWETTWRILGILVWCVLAVPVLLFVRDRPEELGLVPDGYRAEDSNTLPTGTSSQERANSLAQETREDRIASESPDQKSAHLRLNTEKTPFIDSDEQAPVLAQGQKSFTNRERDTKASDDGEPDWDVTRVLRHGVFWRLISVPAMSGMIGTGLVFHQVELMGSRGISEKMALALISLQAIIATISAIGAGWLTDRIPERYLLAAAMLLLASCSLVLWWMPHPVFGLLYAFLMGLHGSILRSAGMVVWLTYYGRKNQGSIRGLSFSAMILAAAFGPIPLAISIDWLGRYDETLILFASMPIVAGLLVFGARPPQAD